MWLALSCSGVVVLACAGVVLSAIESQALQSASQPSDVSLVSIEVKVSNARGDSVRGLSRGDFRLYDNGQPAELVSCSLPMGHDIALVVDRRSLLLGSDRALWRDLRRGLLGFSGDDRFALLHLADGDLQWDHDFTPDTRAILHILEEDEIPPKMQNTKQPIFDGIAEAVRRFPPRKSGRGRVVLVLSNDQARSSRMKPDEAAEAALRADVKVYHVILRADSAGVGVITLPWPLPRPEIRRPAPLLVPSAGMAAVVRCTGGEQVAAAASKSVISALLGSLRDAYVLSYKQPFTMQGEFRTISLELAAATRQKYPGARIIAPSGYYATH